MLFFGVLRIAGDYDDGGFKAVITELSKLVVSGVSSPLSKVCWYPGDL